MEKQYLMGIDIGTTSTKAVLFTLKGKVVNENRIKYPLHSPTPETAEQDPDEILVAVITSIREVMEKSQIEQEDLLCLSFSSSMHSLIAVDDQGKLLTHSITWADTRSTTCAEKLRKEAPILEMYCQTGTPLHPMLPLVKLVWLRESCPEIFEKAAKFISIKEYVFYHLFEDYIVDYAIAAATGLLNAKTLTWNQKALDIAGISENKLSRLVPPTHILEKIPDKWANAMRISPNTPTVIGASDGVLSNLGVGAIEAGKVAVTIGTSGAIRTISKEPILNPEQQLFCYPLIDDYWVIGGAVNNGGIVLRWLRDQFAESEIQTAKLMGKNPYEIIMAIAETIPLGAEGLIFHPYLTGERSPVWNANARASFFGLNINHTKAHLFRAAIEGIFYNLYLVHQMVQDITGKTEKIYATGGLFRSSLPAQILADVFNQEITFCQTKESSAFGAAILALYALKQIPSLESGTEMIEECNTSQPIPENVKKYSKMIDFYSRLLEIFKGEYGHFSP
ncbi:MAG: gluconokinase [Halothece sp.]